MLALASRILDRLKPLWGDFPFSCLRAIFAYAALAAFFLCLPLVSPLPQTVVADETLASRDFQDRLIQQRARARIDRLIRLAQKKSSDDKKSFGDSNRKSSGSSSNTSSGSSNKKSSPPPVKKTSPPPAKKSAPKFEKKQPAPVVKKKQPEPKKTVPAPKKTLPAPTKAPPVVTKEPPLTKQPPVEKAPPVTPGGTPEQQQDNKDFCAQNPGDPSCAKEQAPPQQQDACQQDPSLPGCNTKQPQLPPASDKICKMNPTYPGCDALGSQPGQDGPGRTPPPEMPPGGPQGDVKVPSFCESNPNAPQCQEQQPQDGNQNQPPPVPPGPPPVPPAPPPPPPAPTDSGESGGAPPAPAGPQIQTVTECPAGQVEFLGQCRYPSGCPDGQVGYLDESQSPAEVTCLNSCPDGLIEAESFGGCIGSGYCYSLDGINYEGRCIEQCPQGTERIGNSCQILCPEGQILSYGQCVDACPAGSEWQNGQCREIECEDGQERVGSLCLAACQEGEVREENVCVPIPCSLNETRIDGVCTNVADTSYETAIDLCVDNLGAGGGNSSVIDALQGETLEETCANLIDAMCNDTGELAGVPADQADVCTERPCATGEENVDGRCIQVCQEGQDRTENDMCQCREGVRLEDGSCGASCAQGSYQDANGQCVAECPDGSALNGQCYDSYQCPDGYVRQPNGECLRASCGPDEVVGPDGTCTNPCPEGQQPRFADPERCTAVASCPEGQIPSDGWNNCRINCGRGDYSGASSYVEYDGFCTRRSEVPYDVVLQNCLDGRGHGNDLESLSQEACEAAIVEDCEGQYFDRLNHYCGDIYQPAEDEFVPPPSDGPLCPSGQTAYGDSCVTDDMIVEICSGGVMNNGQCEDACPAGTAQEGNRCVAGGEGTPPAEEQQPPAEEQQPPAEDQQPPPAEDQQPPPADQQPPAEEQKPPEDGQQPPPPPDAGTPPPPPPSDQSQPSGTPAPDKVKSKRKPGAETRKSNLTRIFLRPPLAVVISNDAYVRNSIPGLPHAKAGAEAFSRFLQDSMNLDKSRIVRLSNPKKADLEALFGAAGKPGARLKAELAKAGPSELIVYYAGHALPVDGGKDAVLLPGDGDPANAGETGYRLSTLYANLRKLGVGRLRLYLDAGFNENLNAIPMTIGASPKAVNFMPSEPIFGTANPRWVVLSAGRGNQAVLSRASEPVSAFNRTLLQGLRGFADRAGNRNGAVSAGELASYVRYHVQRTVSAVTGGTQTPTLSGDVREILIAFPATVSPDVSQPGLGPASRPAVAPASPAPSPEPGKKAAPATEVTPSFDCSKAGTADEKAICANADLAAFDRQMAELYYARRRALQGRQRSALVEAQKRWIKRRQTCQGNVRCMTIIYRQWIKSLQ